MTIFDELLECQSIGKFLVRPAGIGTPARLRLDEGTKTTFISLYPAEVDTYASVEEIELAAEAFLSIGPKHFPLGDRFPSREHLEATRLRLNIDAETDAAYYGCADPRVSHRFHGEEREGV